MTACQRGTADSLSIKRLLLLVIIFLTHLSPIIGYGSSYQIALGSVFVIALFTRTWEVLHLSLLLFLLSLNSVLFPVLTGNVPSAKFLLPLGMSTAIVLLFFRTRVSLSWAKWGDTDRGSVVLVCITGFVSTAVLLLWAFWTDNLGVGVRMVQGFSQYPKWAVFALGVPLFALANAFAEEVIFRGIMQAALGATFKRQYLVIILQASAFAAFHFAGGFPNGCIGYLMAFTYGIMLGYLRERTQGLFAPYSAHVIADLAIGYFLCIYYL